MAGFMKLQVWQEPAYEHANGSGEVSPISMLDEHERGVLVNKYAWWGQYTAPGYMDQTEVSGPYQTNDEAALETFRLFGDGGETALVTDDEEECINMLVDMGVNPQTATKQVLS